MSEIKFGYWPRKLDLNGRAIGIRLVNNVDEIVEVMKANGRVVRGWYYPPLTVEGIYERAYALALTHSLMIADGLNGGPCGEFLIALLGMLEGIRLLPEGWVHFYRAATGRQFSDVYCDDGEIVEVLERALSCWSSVATKVRRLAFGAIHWRVFVECYEQQFERFHGQYMVLDTCYRIYCELNANGAREKTHAKRPEFLAMQYSMLVPTWAKTRKVGQKEECDLSKLRNEFVHEARYGGQPIGFGYPKSSGELDLELGNFNTRLILAMLGIKCGYVRSPVGTRSMFGLDLEP
jgi:hypothetical protein